MDGIVVVRRYEQEIPTMRASKRGGSSSVAVLKLEAEAADIAHNEIERTLPKH